MHCRHWRISPQPYTTCTENVAKYGQHMWFWGIWADRQMCWSHYFAPVLRQSKKQHCSVLYIDLCCLYHLLYHYKAQHVVRMQVAFTSIVLGKALTHRPAEHRSRAPCTDPQELQHITATNHTTLDTGHSFGSEAPISSRTRPLLTSVGSDPIVDRPKLSRRKVSNRMKIIANQDFPA